MVEGLVTRFVENQIPSWLKSGPPSSWTGTVDEWDVLASSAREYVRQKLSHDICEAIALKGFFPDEIVNGTLQRGAQVNNSGMVVRPEPSGMRDLTSRAVDLYSQVRTNPNIHLAGSLMASLESLSLGRYHGQRKSAEAVLAEAQNAVDGFHHQRMAQAQAEASNTAVDVFVSFRGEGGRFWPVGKHRLSRPDLQRLLAWTDRTESYWKVRGHDKPDGYAQWPPFAVISAEEVSV
jgi:hypothetical protein